ncbi:hypothetical protein E4U56_003376 [Claviceps arundinis]|uniref:Uncharacterized protein n=1 Tax=Claviceps arundinis TaxID=1623583 RepID=A0A9P7MNV0_9HYPO|nr:hypothetical protein E4U56_003376 [Claviceps arundinis]
MAMRTANDLYEAKSRKRRRESASDDEEGSVSTRKERHRARPKGNAPMLDLEDAESIVTARIPTKLLTTTWSLGSNRHLNPRHIQKLLKAFVELGGPKRELKQHHLKVLCTGAEVKRMMKALGLQDGKKQAEGMPDFSIWPILEVVAGQHRIRALEEYVREADLGEEELWWPCKFYDRDSKSLEQNIKLRVNNKDVAQPDSNSDIWLHLVAAVSQKPEKFQGKRSEIARDIVDTLGLSSEGVVPMSRLVALWGNEEWRTMITAWCKTAVGRATFKISVWRIMMSCRIDDFWFSNFRQVLDTLASLPGDAASYVTPEDWKKMSDFLRHGRSEMETREFFYPGMGSQKVDQSYRRRPNLLVKLDRESYWQVYEHVVQRGQLSFPDVHSKFGLSELDGKILSEVIDHVVDWLISHRKRTPPNYYKKPGLRVEMVAALQHIDERKLQQAKGRITVPIGEAHGQSIAEAASIIIQQEVLEFVWGRIEMFRSASAKDQLTQRLHTDSAERYRDRFREAEWAGVLDIIRWYMGPEFRPEWSQLEKRQPGDVWHLADVAIHHMKDNVDRDKMWHRKLSSASFRDELGRFLLERCGACEESSLSGQLISETYADAMSVASGNVSTSDRRQVSADTDASGEEDWHSFEDASDLDSVFDGTMAKTEEKTALSTLSTGEYESTQQEVPDRQTQAQPSFSPQAPFPGPDEPSSGQLAMKTTRFRTTLTNRMPCDTQAPEDWRPGLRAGHTKPAANLVTQPTPWDLTSSPNAKASCKRKKSRKSGTLCWFRA